LWCWLAKSQEQRTEHNSHNWLDSLAPFVWASDAQYLAPPGGTVVGNLWFGFLKIRPLEEAMKQSLLPSITIVGLLLALAGSQLRAVAKEPTIDERFRDPGNKTSEGELPLLNAPQSKLVRENPSGDAITGPAYLGVTFGDNARSAVVRSVAPGSPAEQAGLKPGDVVETLQGITIDSPDDVLNIVAKMRPGTMLYVGVSRRVNLHAQAPLSVVPGATTRSVGYSPDPTSNGYNVTTNSSHELLPVPSNVQRNSAKSMPQPNRNAASQRPSPSSSGQRRSNSQNSNQSDGNRGLLGRRR